LFCYTKHKYLGNSPFPSNALISHILLPFDDVYSLAVSNILIFVPWLPAIAAGPQFDSVVYEPCLVAEVYWEAALLETGFDLNPAYDGFLRSKTGEEENPLLYFGVVLVDYLNIVAVFLN